MTTAAQDSVRRERARRRTPRARFDVGFAVANTLLLWVAMAIAAVPLWPIYSGPAVVMMVGGAVVGGSFVAVAGARFRLPAPVVAAATVVVYLIVGVPLAVPGKAYQGFLPTLDGLRDLLAGTALGWKQLLTITLPAGDYQALLVPFFALTVVVTVASLSVALRGRWGNLAVLGPVVLFIGGLLFGPATSLWPIGLALGLLAVSLLWIIWRRWHRRRMAIRSLAPRDLGGVPVEVSGDTRFAGWRTLLSASLILAIAGGAATAAVAVLPPTGERQVLRSAIEQPFEPRDYVSPLSGFRRYWQQPTTDSVIMSVRGLPQGARIRVATLDSYNGVVYSVGSVLGDSASGAFTRVPFQIDQSALGGEQVSLDIQLEDYTGVWLPTVGQFESVSFDGTNAGVLRDSFYYNNAIGTAAVIGGVGTGDRYSLTAVLPAQPSVGQLATLDAGSASVPSLGELPAELSVALNNYISGVDGQGNRLVAMLAGLQRDGYVSHGVGKDEAPSRSGHAADRISELLTDQRMIGDAEQYAVTAALMARELGFPARVVFGFAPKDITSVTEVRGSDVSAWIEVNTAQYGWVSIDPTPAVRPIPDEQPVDPTKIARPQPIVPPPAAAPDPVDRQPTPDTERSDPPTADIWLAILVVAVRVAAWAILVMAVLASPFLLIIAAKVRRRALRKRGTNLQRIGGGWQEFEDTVLDFGYQPPPAATRTEVATVVGGAGSLVLAAVADRASFAPAPPTDDEADLVWRAVSELTASLKLNTNRRDRLRARISLNSLTGYSVRSLFRRRRTESDPTAK